MPLSGTEISRERASGNAEQHRWPGMQAAGEHSRRTAPPRAAAFWLVARGTLPVVLRGGRPIAAVRDLPGSAAVLGDHADRCLRHLRPRPSPHAAGLRVGVGLSGPPSSDSRQPLHHRRCLRPVPGRRRRRPSVRRQGVAGCRSWVGDRGGRGGADRPGARGGWDCPADTGGATLMGLGAGALGTSALVQYGPAPTHLVWWLLLGASVVGAAVALAIPEPETRRPGVLASLRPRVAVPSEARASFIVAAPCLIAAWALNGLFLSLGPSLAAQVFASPNLLWGGLVIFLLLATGAAATVACRAVSPSVATVTGCLTLVAGTVATLAAIEWTSGAAFLTGTALAGVGTRGSCLPRCLPHHHRARPSQRACRRDCCHLHPLLFGAQRPGSRRRAGNNAFRPAPHRACLLRGDGRARRGRSRQPDAPQARPGHRPRALARPAPGPGGSTVPARWFRSRAADRQTAIVHDASSAAQMRAAESRPSVRRHTPCL